MDTNEILDELFSKFSSKRHITSFIETNFKVWFENEKAEAKISGQPNQLKITSKYQFVGLRVSGSDIIDQEICNNKVELMRFPNKCFNEYGWIFAMWTINPDYAIEQWRDALKQIEEIQYKYVEP